MIVIDTETTGLTGYPNDRVLEIGICELKEDSGRIIPLYDELIRYPDIAVFDSKYVNRDGSSGCWIFRNSDMKMNDVLNARKDLETVVKEVRSLVEGKEVTSYNVQFDFDKFLFREPWNLNEIVTIPYDVMDMATKEVYSLAYADKITDKDLQKRLIFEKENSRYPNKWVKSQDTYTIFCPEDPLKMRKQSHRALDDSMMEAHILKKLL